MTLGESATPEQLMDKYKLKQTKQLLKQLKE
jgi:hypothetical protein